MALEAAQERAIVAANIDDQVLRIQLVALAYNIAQVKKMRLERVGGRRDIEVIVEHSAGRYRFTQLDVVTIVTEAYAQRIEWLRLAQFVLAQKLVGQRR